METGLGRLFAVENDSDVLLEVNTDITLTTQGKRVELVQKLPPGDYTALALSPNMTSTAGIQISDEGPNVFFDASNLQRTTGLVGDATNGIMMVGMAVTAYFADGSVEEAIWDGTGAYGTSWSLIESGYTMWEPWMLSSTGNAIERLLLDGGTGNAVFDITFGGAFGTPVSSAGRTFMVESSVPSDLEVFVGWDDFWEEHPGNNRGLTREQLWR